MPQLTEVLPLVQAMAPTDRRELFKILFEEFKAEVQANVDIPFVFDPANPMLGWLHDDPELADQIVREVSERRESRNWRTNDE
jgi:hypothetical protein